MAGQLKEQSVVNRIEKMLGSRWSVNVHGTVYSRNGTADIVTLDKDGRLVGIECKAPSRRPKANQWLSGISLLMSGGRLVIGYDDFDVRLMDAHELPTAVVTMWKNDTVESVAYSLADSNQLPNKNTYEVILERL